MPRNATIDPARPVGINVACESPHVIAYRFWMMLPGGKWQVVGEGQTGDDLAAFFPVGPAPKGARLAYWLGIGGNANSAFRAVVTLSQDGQMVQGGLCIEPGVTNDDHVAEVQSEVEFV